MCLETRMCECNCGSAHAYVIQEEFSESYLWRSGVWLCVCFLCVLCVLFVGVFCVCLFPLPLCSVCVRFLCVLSMLGGPTSSDRRR